MFSISTSKCTPFLSADDDESGAETPSTSSLEQPQKSSAVAQSQPFTSRAEESDEDESKDKVSSTECTPEEVKAHIGRQELRCINCLIGFVLDACIDFVASGLGCNTDEGDLVDIERSGTGKQNEFGGGDTRSSGESSKENPGHHHNAQSSKPISKSTLRRKRQKVNSRSIKEMFAASAKKKKLAQEAIKLDDADVELVQVDSPDEPQILQEIRRPKRHV